MGLLRIIGWDARHSQCALLKKQVLIACDKLELAGYNVPADYKCGKPMTEYHATVYHTKSKSFNNTTLSCT
eukprot:m.13814 g.13814  ORF g.13814 m.13814 type:complete len:71 (+) comp6031_c0_seq1:152-364(+)